MLEVEIKFRFTPQQLSLFQQRFLGSVRRFSDEYFDRVALPAARSLAASDIWLRRRLPHGEHVGKWQCKVPSWRFSSNSLPLMSTSATQREQMHTRQRRQSGVESYVELETPADIARLLASHFDTSPHAAVVDDAVGGIGNGFSLTTSFLKQRFDVVRLGAFATTRHSFRVNDEAAFRVDFDLCPELDYAVGEVEIVERSESDGGGAQTGVDELLAFCRRHELDTTPPMPPGKVIVFLAKHYPLIAREAMRRDDDK